MSMQPNRPLPTPRDSVGALRGNVAPGFGGIGAASAKARRAAQAALTPGQLGAYMKRDDLGRDAVDVDALEAELARRAGGGS